MANSNKERDIFFEAIELDAVKRDQFVARRCGTDSDLSSRVRALLVEHDQESDFLMDQQKFTGCRIGQPAREFD